MIGRINLLAIGVGVPPMLSNTFEIIEQDQHLSMLYSALGSFAVFEILTQSFKKGVVRMAIAIATVILAIYGRVLLPDRPNQDIIARITIHT